MKQGLLRTGTVRHFKDKGEMKNDLLSHKIVMQAAERVKMKREDSE